MLASAEFDRLEAAKLVGQFVEEAGKEAAAKRARLRLVVSLAEEFYRDAHAGVAHRSPSPLSSPICAASLRVSAAAALRWLPGDEAAAACLDVCLDAAAISTPTPTRPR